MMFDPPDYPYKDLSDTLRDHYDSDDLLLNVPGSTDTDNNKSLAEITEQMITSVENQLSFHSNDSGRFFNVENTTFNISSTQNTELYIVQSTDNLMNYEPTLLDDNTVNQFLLPLQTSGENKDAENDGPDLLALHSCVICHDIFTTDADLLDHTISVHASDNAVDNNHSLMTANSREEVVQAEGTLKAEGGGRRVVYLGPHPKVEVYSATRA